MRIAVIGSINMDQVVTAGRIPGKGETISGNDLRYIPGGKGANQAVAMARLKADVTMFGCVGDDEHGRMLTENLSENGVNTEHIRILKGVPTGLAVITVAEKDNVIIVISGANAHVDNAYVDEIAPLLGDYDFIVLQHEIPLSAVHHVVNVCAGRKIPVVLNPAPAATVPMEIVERVSYLTPNEHEAALIFGDDLTVEEMLMRYPEKLIITRGSQGVSAALQDGSILHVPARLSDVVDTTGAGDTLNGAFCVRMAAGDTLEQALRYANTAAGLSVERFGAQGGMPTADEVTAALG